MKKVILALSAVLLLAAACNSSNTNQPNNGQNPTPTPSATPTPATQASSDEYKLYSSSSLGISFNYPKFLTAKTQITNQGLTKVCLSESSKSVCVFDAIVGKNIGSDSDLIAFFNKATSRSGFSMTCDAIQNKTSSDTNQQGVSKITIQGKSPEAATQTSGCFLNYVYSLYYYPQTKSAVYWNLGQAASIYRPGEKTVEATKDSKGQTYDFVVVQSTKFLE